MKDSLRAEVLQFRKCNFFFSTEALNSIELPPSLEVLAAGDSKRALFALIWQPFWGDSGPRKPGNSLRNYARWVLVQYHLRLRGLICAFLSWLLWRQIWVSCMVQHKVPKIGSSNEKILLAGGLQEYVLIHSSFPHKSLGPLKLPGQ